MFRVVFWDILPCKIIVDLKKNKKRGMVPWSRHRRRKDDNNFTRQYNPEDNSEHHTRRRENLKSHRLKIVKRT
jgi:hypothetical protein